MKLLGMAISEPVPVGGTTWVIQSNSLEPLIAHADRQQRRMVTAAAGFRGEICREGEMGKLLGTCFERLPGKQATFPLNVNIEKKILALIMYLQSK